MSENNRLEIVVTDNNTIAVVDTAKGVDSPLILFEANTFMQCCDYIRKTYNHNRFRLSSWPDCKTYTDTEGRTLPIILDVIFY